ncbi:MAG: DNA translocase FtsK 4TM domain-containing protein [bacterium]|nr:DNA translocase FtsK 4TM domain-containing protein [bacterium]
MSYWMETVLKTILYMIMGTLSLFAISVIILALIKSFLKLSTVRQIQTIRIFFITAAALIITSIITFNSYDYSQLNPFYFHIQPVVLNKCGIVGAITSLWFKSIFGICAWLIPFLLLLWGLMPYRYWAILPLKTLFIIGVSLLLCLSFSSFPQLNTDGGLLGNNLKIFLNRYFGVGKWFVIFAILFGMALTFDVFRNAVFSFFANLFNRIFRRHKSNSSFQLETQDISTTLPKENIVEQPTEISTPLQADESIPPIKSDEPVPCEIQSELTPPETQQQPEIIPQSNPPQADQIPLNPLDAALKDTTKFKEMYLEKLKLPDNNATPVEDEQVLKNNANLLESKFAEFGVKGRITNAAPGPVITRYELELDPGIKVSQVASLADDIALSMKSARIRIEAPIPGKAAIGIEVPNQHRQSVYIRELLSSKEFDSDPATLCTALGKDIAGEPVYADAAEFPHLLVAGTTGSGKSVFINTIIASILYRASPADVRFLMIDPKRLELRLYNGIPHLVRPVISDAKESLGALKEALSWMEIRYKEFAIAGVRDIAGYNQKASVPKPYIVILIDELADLMLTAPRDIEIILTRLAQMSRAVGIHLVIATQRPSVDIITGLIKANFPARIAFQVASKTDSRTILDMNGAEKLLGKGDMLFLPPGEGVTKRVHSAYISTQESKHITDLWALKWLKELLEDKIENSSQISDDIVRQDLVESLVCIDTLPGAAERIEMFAKATESKYGLSGVSDLLLSLDYYPELPERNHILETRPIDFRQGGNESVSSSNESNSNGAQGITNNNEKDELFNEAKELVIRHRVASVSLLQRQFKIGYARAGRLIDELEKAGVVGPYVGSKSREVILQPSSAN